VKPPYTQPPYTQAYRTPARKDPGVACLVPDFSAYGPLVSGVTRVRNDSSPVKDAQKQLDYCNKLQRQQEQWALNVLSCFDNPSAPMVQEVHWRCLIGKVTVPLPQRQEFSTKALSTAWIPEREQVILGFYPLFML
jgi:hypothetical protein